MISIRKVLVIIVLNVIPCFSIYKLPAYIGCLCYLALLNILFPLKSRVASQDKSTNNFDSTTKNVKNLQLFTVCSKQYGNTRCNGLKSKISNCQTKFVCQKQSSKVSVYICNPNLSRFFSVFTLAKTCIAMQCRLND